MKPKLLCRACGAELSVSDKFCAACGSPVDWGVPEGETLPEPTKAPNAGQDQVCPLCGHRNPGSADTCESCGSRLVPSGKTAVQQHSKKGASVPSAPPLKTLQSWKLTAGLAIVLIAVIIFVVTTKKQPTTPTQTSPELSPNAAAVISQIDSLQKIVNADPNNPNTLLQLANMLYDVHAYPRAVMAYDRYLQLVPSNADARVDMGIAYFEMSFADSLHAAQYLESAEQEMKKALTYQPRHQLACFNLGIIQLHSGNMDEANTWFKKCIAIDSTTEVGRRAEQFLTQHSLTKRSPS